VDDVLAPDIERQPLVLPAARTHRRQNPTHLTLRAKPSLFPTSKWRGGKSPAAPTFPARTQISRARHQTAGHQKILGAKIRGHAPVACCTSRMRCSRRAPPQWCWGCCVAQPFSQSASHDRPRTSKHKLRCRGRAFPTPASGSDPPSSPRCTLVVRWLHRGWACATLMPHRPENG
jgi:hypothetical protein